MARTDNEVANEIRQQLALLKQKIGETGGELDRCKSEEEQYSVEYYACREHSSRYTNLQQQHGDQNTQVKALKAQKEAMEASIRNNVSIKVTNDVSKHTNIKLQSYVSYIIRFLI